MKNFFIIIFIALTFNSCSDDSNERADATRLTRMIRNSDLSSDLNELITDYSYEGKKLKDIRFGSTRWEYIYSDSNIIFINRYSNSDLEFKTTYQYDSKGRVSSELLEDMAQGYPIKNDFTYNSDNTISYKESYPGLSDEIQNKITGIIYMDSEGQILKHEKMFLGVLSRRVVWTYDSKNNPFKNITGYQKLPMNFRELHNFRTKHTYDENEALLNKTTYDYQYNSDGYPINSVETFYYPSGYSSTNNVKYFYN